MSDERTDNGMQPGGGFDDDRLLAYALGLDDDPELLAAAENDAALSGRLAAMRADVDRIGAQIAAAVPAPEDAYTDLSGERWSGLKEYFEAPASEAKPRRERRWWRVVAPVTALAVLAVVVGIVAVNQGTSSSTSDSSAEVALSSSGAVQPGSAESLSPDTGTEKSTGTERPPRTPRGQRHGRRQEHGGRADDGRGAPRRPARPLRHRRARPRPRGDRRAAALRGGAHLQGRSAPGGGARGGRPAGRPGEAAPADARPDAGRRRGVRLARAHPVARGRRGGAVLGTPLAVSYTYGGEPTMVREFAAGTDPDMVNLPLR